MRRVLILVAFILMASATALPFAAITHAAGPEWVVVNPGDTLFSIAARYGVPVDRLIRANNLPNANFVYSGQRLLIPDALMTFPDQPQQPVQVADAAPAQPAKPVSVVYYTVSPGDSLANIAARYGVSVAAIAQANHLTNWNFVWYGQRLVIPGTSQVNPVPQPIVSTAPAQLAAPPPTCCTDDRQVD